MTDRATQIADRLRQTEWRNWRATQIAADASARSYTRLSSVDGQTVILMDAPPDTGEDTAPFAMMTHHLREAGLSAPAVLLHDRNLGLMVLEDLGAADFARHIALNPNDAAQLYTAATDVLIQLASLTPPEALSRMTPGIGGEMIGITAEWYAGGVESTALCDAMTEHLARFAPVADALALRDFHAENLIWRPAQSGLDQVGLLDYQDAFIAPVGYDLASLLRDARRTVDPDLSRHLIARFAQQTGQNQTEFNARFAVLSVQRNLRILGVFARLVLRDKKPKYLRFLPIVWQHVQTDLAQPELHKLAEVVAETLPPPDGSTLKDIL